MLSSKGFCSPFDVKASGYTRAEACGIIYLQKRKDARRCYGQLVYSKSNCDGYKDEGIHYPSGKVQMKLLKEFYQDLDMPASMVDYVEAHATGTVVGKY